MSKVDRKVNGSWLKYDYETGKKVATKSYTVWAGIQTRCLTGGAYQRRRPTYKGCSASEDFKSFQRFTDWHVAQIGYDKDGYQLDKDILIKGNKLYSRDTCVLVPKQLNNLFSGIDSGRYGCPPGVHFDSLKGRWIAQISSNGKQKYLGGFSEITEASRCYEINKVIEIENWIHRLEAGEFEIDPIVIHALRERL